MSIGLQILCYLPHIYQCAAKQVEILAANKDTCNVTYKTFIDALQEAEESYSLKIHTGTLDEEDWESEYICIQKKDKKIKQCVVKDLRPMAVGLFFYLIKYKKYVIL